VFAAYICRHPRRNAGRTNPLGFIAKVCGSGITDWPGENGSRFHCGNCGRQGEREGVGQHESHIYHKGGRWYGKTKAGKFMTESEAKAAGYKEAHRE
jgi:predicted RNA-binding Zn-ribbon protein involved in translation (DUF1610 family)